jgi:hypothetical protein
MRILHSFFSPLAVVTLCTAAASPAAAQQASSEHVRPALRLATFPGTPAPTRTVAVYRFSASSPTGIPAQVTIADSAGTLVATLRRSTGGRLPMAIAVSDTDIMLQAATPDGLLTLVFYEQNDAETAGTLIGRWRLGEREGELRGQATR